MNEKLCISCNLIKPVAEFYRNAGHRDGLSSRCIPCTRAEMAERWRAKHPEPPPYQRPTEKLCKKCGQTKPLDDFYPHKRTRDGVQYWCKTCQKTAIVSGYRNNPQKHAAYNRNWDRRNPDRKADIQLKVRLGIPHGTYATMLAAQEGKCAICSRTEPGGRTRRFHVDHDNATGKVRGLLCGPCNTGIGQLQHDTNLLLSAVKYLQDHHPNCPVFDADDSIRQPNC